MRSTQWRILPLIAYAPFATSTLTSFCTLSNLPYALLTPISGIVQYCNVHRPHAFRAFSPDAWPLSVSETQRVTDFAGVNLFTNPIPKSLSPKRSCLNNCCTRTTFTAHRLRYLSKTTHAILFGIKVDTDLMELPRRKRRNGHDRPRQFSRTLQKLFWTKRTIRKRTFPCAHRQDRWHSERLFGSEKRTCTHLVRSNFAVQKAGANRRVKSSARWRPWYWRDSLLYQTNAELHLPRAQWVWRQPRKLLPEPNMDSPGNGSPN